MLREPALFLSRHSAPVHMGRQLEAQLIEEAVSEVRELVVSLRDVQENSRAADASSGKSNKVHLFLEDFMGILPTLMADAASPEQLGEWFRMADIDGDGAIDLTDFFAFSLAVATAASRSGMSVRSPVEKIFDRYDQDNSGYLDEIEFLKSTQDLGFGERAKELFAELRSEGGLREDGTLSYKHLLHSVGVVARGHTMKSYQKALAQSRKVAPAFTEIDTSGWYFTGEDTESARLALKQLLTTNRVKLTDIFRSLDNDQSGQLNQEEFKTAFEEELGFAGLPVVTLAVWSELDNDHSGSVGFAELDKWVFGGFEGEAHDTNKNLSLRSKVHASDDEWDEPRLKKELVAMIKENEMTVTELVMAWDQSGDNQIAKKELLSIMKKLVADENLWYTVVRSSVIAAFAKMDRGGDGFVNLEDLGEWISSTDKPSIHGGTKAARIFGVTDKKPRHVLRKDGKVQPLKRLKEIPVQPKRRVLKPPSRDPPPLYCSKYSPWIEEALRAGEGTSRLAALNQRQPGSARALALTQPGSPRDSRLRLRAATADQPRSPRSARRPMSLSSPPVTPRYDGTWRAPPSLTSPDASSPKGFSAQQLRVAAAPIPSAAWCEEVVDAHIDASRQSNTDLMYGWAGQLRSRRAVQQLALNESYGRGRRDVLWATV